MVATTRWATKGISRATWFRAIKDGRLVPVHRGVARVAACRAPLSRRSPPPCSPPAPKSMASHRLGRPAVGDPAPDDDPIEVIVARRNRSPRRRGRRRAPATGHGGPHAVQRGGPRTTNVAAAAAVRPREPVDGASVSRRSATSCRPAGVAGRALRRGDRPPLAPRSSRRAGLPGALEEWVIDGQPADSVLEVAMRRLFEHHRLPPFEFHARIAGLEVDFRIVGAPVVLECDGWEFHAKTRAQPGRDAERRRHAGRGRLRRDPVHLPPDRAPPGRTGPRITGVLRRWAPELVPDLGRTRRRYETVRAQMTLRPTRRCQRAGASARRVVGVDADVAVGEVAAPDRGRGVAGAEADVDHGPRRRAGSRRAAASAASSSRVGVDLAGRRSGSRPAPGRCRSSSVHLPMAMATRPQFGSAPCTAVFTSGELTIALATRLAWASSRAPSTHDLDQRRRRPRRRGRLLGRATGRRRAARPRSASRVDRPGGAAGQHDGGVAGRGVGVDARRS